jgi:ribosomal protein S7
LSKTFGKKKLATFSTLIRKIKYRLITKLISRMTDGRKIVRQSLINLSLEIVYCSTTLDCLLHMSATLRVESNEPN